MVTSSKVTYSCQDEERLFPWCLLFSHVSHDLCVSPHLGTDGWAWRDQLNPEVQSRIQTPTSMGPSSRVTISPRFKQMNKVSIHPLILGPDPQAYQLTLSLPQECHLPPNLDLTLHLHNHSPFTTSLSFP